MDSSSDTDSYVGSAASVSAIEESGELKVIEAVQNAFNPLPLDRAIVIEAQHSGVLNALTKDLLILKQEAQTLAADNASKASQVQSLLKKTEQNIEWLTSSLAQLEEKVKRRLPIEYAQAESKIIWREED